MMVDRLTSAQWMPMYWGDYARDTGHLSTIEHGAYLLLIVHYWSTGRALADSDTLFANVTRLTLKRWRKMRPTIEQLFQRRDGRWYHKRVERELSGARRMQRNASKPDEFVPQKSERNQRNGPAQPQPQPQPQSDSKYSPTTHAHSGAARGPESARAPVTASLVPDNWEPSPELLARIRRGRPDLVGAFYETRLLDFREWCSAKAVTTHHIESTFSTFMRNSKAPPITTSRAERARAAIERAKRRPQ